jgi:hypothetical protein
MTSSIAAIPEDPRLAVVLELFRDLGYPIDPLPVDRAEWRRAGIEIPDTAHLTLVSRRADFDFYLLTSESGIAPETIRNFLASLSRRNSVIKNMTLFLGPAVSALHDLNGDGRLRALPIDLTLPADRLRARLDGLELTGRNALPIATILDRALDRESLSRSFFERFRRAVAAVAADLGASAGSSQRADCRFEEEVEQQSLLILSRILFLYFVQRKGWLSGQRRFLIDHFDACRESGSSYFSSVLRPLFFSCLNMPVAERDGSARALGRIPYLNGGLFEPSAIERRLPELSVSNEVLEDVLENVFERYEFSVDERDSSGSHIDPEMLGKVFESLMAGDERSRSGSFYTPREVVDTLVRRAVLVWACGDDAPLIADLNALLDGESVDIPRKSAAEIMRRLDRATVLDPACGSGAFLLSALVWIERLIRLLAPFCGRSIEDDLRQRIVERSLYGVDLKPEAVRLCELRLWLAIVSGEDGEVSRIPPLPNLDRNILQGNSLVGPADFLGDGRLVIYRAWMERLRSQGELIERYRRAPRNQRASLARRIRLNDLQLARELLERALEADELELREASLPARDLFGLAETRRPAREVIDRISSLRQQLGRIERGELSFFSFDVHFAPVTARGGFDLVVGNPPWVRNRLIEAPLRKTLTGRFRTFRKPGGFNQCDLSVVFVERALALAAAGGVVSMLLPSKVSTAGYGAAIRAEIERHQIVAVDDWGHDARGWFEADTFPLGLTVCKRSPEGNSVRISARGESFSIRQRELSSGRGMEWPLLHPDALAIIRRLESKFPTLGETLGRKPFMGVKSGDNARFFPHIVRVGARFAETREGVRIPIEALCRCVRGRDVRPWSVKNSSWMLWPPRGGWRRRPPAWLQALAESTSADPHGYTLAYVRPEHAGIKVVWKDVARGLSAVVIPDRVHCEGSDFTIVPNQTLYGLEADCLDEAYGFAALLNSSIVGALVIPFAEPAKDHHYRYFGRTISAVPLPPIARRSPEWRQLVRLSRRAHAGVEIGSALDALVASIYGVDGREEAILRRMLDARLGR